RWWTPVHYSTVLLIPLSLSNLSRNVLSLNPSPPQPYFNLLNGWRPSILTSPPFRNIWCGPTAISKHDKYPSKVGNKAYRSLCRSRWSTDSGLIHNRDSELEEKLKAATGLLRCYPWNRRSGKEVRIQLGSIYYAIQLGSIYFAAVKCNLINSCLLPGLVPTSSPMWRNLSWGNAPHRFRGDQIRKVVETWGKDKLAVFGGLTTAQKDIKLQLQPFGKPYTAERVENQKSYQRATWL
ncbi:LOW QUALITY PROTEIN: hypothetical protein M8C21_024701, partial [Ambrosia artemisiifolia]